MSLLRVRNSQSEHKGSKLSDSRKSSLGKGVKLPQLGRNPVDNDYSHLLVHSSPMKFNKYSINRDSQTLAFPNQKPT
jgi:hypothetical protein